MKASTDPAIIAQAQMVTIPKIVEKVGTVTTPGETVDVLVTETGIAVNPRLGELAERQRSFGFVPRDIADLQREAMATSQRQPFHSNEGRIITVSEYRDGSITDLIRQVQDKTVGHSR